MAGRSLDLIIMDALGLKEMTISRLLWQIEDLKATLDIYDHAATIEDAKASIAALKVPQG